MRTPRVTYSPRCPACGSRIRPRDFSREPQPISPRDVLGQRIGGRASIVSVDSISYADSDPLVGVIRRRWISRLRLALSALEGVPAEVVRRFRGLSSYRTTCVPATTTFVATPVTLRYGGIRARN